MVWAPFLLGSGLKVKVILEWISLWSVHQSALGISLVCSPYGASSAIAKMVASSLRMILGDAVVSGQQSDNPCS